MTSGQNAAPLVATAADHRFARTLQQFLLSLERHGENHRSRIVIHDLGLSDADRSLLARRFSWADVRRFRFEDHPPHVALAAGSYAWKPLILAELAQGFSGPLLWFDSGTVLKAPLDGILACLARDGFWGLRSQTALAAKCDPRVLDALAVPPEVRHIREYAAGAVGFDLASPLGRALVEEWAAHAAIADHIVPADYAAFHKHDQAVLNCLLAKAIFAGDLAPARAEIDISSASPSPLISTRNYVSAKLPLWADPAARALRSAYKEADRLYHVASRIDNSWVDGWRRSRKEHFSVYLRHLGTRRETAIPGPAYGYYADPFLVQRHGQHWLFVEEYSFARDLGHLTVLGLDSDLAVTSAEPVVLLPEYVALDCHASFPCIFEHGGEIYMVPETHQRRAVDLFICERWPDRWRLVRRLLFGRDAADSMLVRQGGLWFLLTSVQGDCPNRHLEIYHAPELLSGSFTPHPVNTERRYGGKRHGTGRNAGTIIRRADGTLIRIMQNSTNFYGEGVRAMAITRLTATDFTEEPTDKIDFLDGFSTHHVTLAGPLLAYDTRDRTA